jgi:S-methylmethionine-dependent homocysteine/selenocysteine methylase
MSKYRDNLPQLKGGLFLTDGGLETTLVFHQGIELPHFAAFDLLKNQEGCQTLQKYFEDYIPLAQAGETGFILESATWRASADWGEKFGYSQTALNRKSIEMLVELRNRHESEKTPMVISGCVGPRGDGYAPQNLMSAGEAECYHAEQIQTFAATEADMVSAFTINYVEEAIGITRAAQAANIPVVISFTVETDGRLPTGQTLQNAIEQVDAATANGPVYYMINCAHPTHFANELAEVEPWIERIRGLRANASCRSHAELDESVELDSGNPEELGLQYRELLQKLPNLSVLGGCCGTDHRHIQAISEACLAGV